MSGRIGYGVFAEETLPPDTFLGEYTGSVKQRPWLELERNDYTFRYPTSRWFHPIYIIDAQKGGNITRFLNHHKDPNTEAVGVLTGPIMRILFRTTRQVRVGEQLTFDYGPLFWRNRFQELIHPVA